MFKGNSLFFKLFQYLAAKSDLGVHHIFFDIDSYEAFFTCNTGNGIDRFVAGTCHDHGSFIFRLVGITDVDRNTRFAYREDRILMKHSCSHIGKLTKLAVCNYINGLRILNETRVCYQETRHIGPVLIEICFCCFCNDGTGNIRSTSGKCLDLAICISTIESRNDSLLQFCQFLFHQFIGSLCIKFSIFIKTDHLCGIHKRESQIICHNNAIQVLTTGCCIITSCFFLKLLCDHFKFMIQ